MKKNSIIAIRLTLVCLVFFCGVYTLVILGIAQLAPNNGEGKVIVQDGNKYYVNIGQSFTEDRYFWSRPSAIDYHPIPSGGSNKGPSNPKYLQLVQARIDSFLVHNPSIEKAQIPSELVTASGSGLDPHISPKGALVQVPRIARIRNIPEDELHRLVEKYTDDPLLGLFGTQKINVLKLNLALDKLTPQK